LRVRAPPGQARKVTLMGALDAATGELVVSTSPTKTSADFIALLRRLDWRHGPKPGGTRPPVVMVLDNGPIHTSKASRAALAERPWITVGWLPRYAPELNDIERSWRDLKLFMLDWLESPELRQRCQASLSKSEQRHVLAQVICTFKQGRIAALPAHVPTARPR